MEAHLVAFLQAMRAAGARVSLAEGNDSALALAELGALQREHFRYALRSCLSKSPQDQAIFNQLFPPLFFGAMSNLFIPREKICRMRKGRSCN